MHISPSLDFESACGIVTVLVIVAWLYQSRSRHVFMRRKFRLQRGTEASIGHGKALQEFLSHPGDFDELRTFLVVASELMEQKEFALKIHEIFQSSAVPGKKTAIWQQVLDLGSAEPVAYDLFLAAFLSGIVAALLRWPETAPAVESWMTVPVNLRREVDFTFEAVTARSRPDFGLAAA